MFSAMGSREIPSGDRGRGTRRLPAEKSFKRGIVQAFSDGFAHKPATTFGTMNSDNRTNAARRRRPEFLRLHRANPLPSPMPRHLKRSRS